MSLYENVHVKRKRIKGGSVGSATIPVAPPALA